MTWTRGLCRTIRPAVFIAIAVALAMPSRAADEATVAALAGQTHFHGIAIASADPLRLHLATHHGLWLVEADGTARRISNHGDDLMGFTPHPTDRATLFASGHPASGGNLGVIASSDGGRSWRKLADGVDGPVDFHQMDVSKADPAVIWGVHGGLQRSGDGGRSWRRVGPSPAGLIALAASRRDVDTLYAATRGGLLRSTDGGRSWRAAHPSLGAATAVHVTGDGEVLAFLAGVGLVRASETAGALTWRTVGGPAGGLYLLYLAAAGERRLAAVSYDMATKRQGVMVSEDGGARWRPLGAAMR